MRFKILAAGALIGLASLATAQTPTTTAPTDTKWVTVDGEVVRYDPGKVIVIRAADGKDVVYTLAPSVPVPADVQVGRRVLLYTEPRPDGSSQLVRRVTTTSVNAEGQTKRTTDETRTSASGATTTTTTTTISGKVAAYEPGRTLTIIGSDGNRVTYLITDKSQVPAEILVGKTVTVLPVNGSGGPTAQTITVIKTETVPQD
jgi:hypothetical protein